MKPATSRRLRPLTGSLLIALAALLGWLAFSKKSDPPSLAQKAPPVRYAPASSPALSSPSATSPKPALAATLPSAGARAALLHTLAALRALQGAGTITDTQARELLDHLRAELAAGNLAVTVAAIVEFLVGGEDAATSLAFAMEDGGALSAAPSLRTFLLDQLGQLDPVAAAGFSREFLALPLSPATIPDESSLCLRNLAWGSPGPLAAADRILFDARATALLQNTDWAARPSAGFLEGFDAVVFSGNPALVAPLARIMNGAAAASTRHAAHIAMDRLALAGDSAVIAAIATEPSLSEQPGLRASLLARADVTNAAQRAIIETYLRDPSVGETEKKTFIAAFPLRSFTDGPRLITQPKDQEGADLITSDRASLVVMREWATDHSLSPLHPSLTATIIRLQSMLR
jgi:hypothetical protein